MPRSATTIPVQLPDKLRPVFEGPARYRGAYGGRGSAKSRSFAAMLLVDGLGEPGPILCARELQVSLKESVHAELCGLVDDLGLQDYYEYGREFLRTRPGYFPGGATTEFVYSGLRYNTQGIKSKSRFRRCWVEEAEYVSEQSWKDLVPTIRLPGSEIWLTWNPEVKGSATDKRFIESPPADARIVEMNWRDNPWFPVVLEAERLNDLRRDPDAYHHVWEGKYATRSDAQVMHGKWGVAEFEPNVDPKRGPVWDGPYDGADWGFAVDPTVRVRCWIYGSNLWIEREAYGAHVELLDLPALFDRFPESKRTRIRADSARPETISYMRSQGYSIEAAAKWPGSVEDGIAHLRGAYDRIVVHPRCVRTAEEMRLYSYKVDRRTGDVLPDVVDKHNHCLAGDTLVDTADGQFPIRDLIGRTGTAFTLDGPRRFHSVRQTSEREAVYRVRTTDGRTFRCTADHPVMTSNGWVPAIALAPDMRILTVDADRYAMEGQCHQNTCGLTERDTVATSGPATTSGVEATASHRPISTETCGGGFAARSPKATKFTIRSVTKRLSIHAAWSALRPLSTTSFTPTYSLMTNGRRGGGISSRERFRRRSSGIRVTKAESGIRGTRAGRSPLGPMCSPASGAAQTSSGRALSSRESFALTLANPLGDGRPALMTFSGNVLTVGPPSPSTDTSTLRAALDDAPGSTATVADVEFAGYEPVYNLEVEAAHHFTVEGGLVVHNCMDAIRYAIQPLIRPTGGARSRSIWN